MPSKKKKYNARFPPARIKKIMQKDEEVGKVASTVPVMISRLLELFTESLILKTNELTLSVNARTLTTGHLKQIILSERKFDFLKDLVTHIPDVQANEEDGGDSNSDQGVRVRPRGRPRKIKDQVSSVPKKRGRKPKAAAAATSVDDVGDEGVTDGSETEDADSCSDEEDGESMSEDTAAEAGGSCHQSCKRHCVEDSFSSTCGSTSSAHCADAVGQGASDTLATASSTSLLLANKLRGETFRSDLTASCSSNVPTIFRNNTGAGKTVNETCLPLNLTLSGSAATTMNTATSALDFKREKTEPHPRQLPMRINFERTASDTNTSCLLASPGLCMPRPPPPPAHQPVTQASGTPIVPSSVLSFNFGMNLFPQTASEFLPQSNSTGVLLTYGTTPVSSGSLVKGTPIGSQVLSDGTPPVTISTTSSSCGHAVHRMPIVPASFLPGAILARSMSVPHSCSASKPSSLVISPEDDYDS